VLQLTIVFIYHNFLNHQQKRKKTRFSFPTAQGDGKKKKKRYSLSFHGRQRRELHIDICEAAHISKIDLKNYN